VIIRFSDALDKLVRWLAIFLLAVMFIIVFGNAFLRYMFEINFIGAYDLSRIVFIWSVFLTVSIVYKQKAHSRFTFLYLRLNGATKFIVDIIINLLTAAFLSIIIFVGSVLAYSARIQVLPASGVSATWLYLPIVAGSIITLIHLITFLYQDIKKASYGLEVIPENINKDNLNELYILPQEAGGEFI